jgi:phosphohistidine phosphatase
MKKLLLIRHARATHESSFADFERPLTSKGLKQAETMASRLQTNSILPQSLVASPALRTLSTANVFSQTLGLQQAVTNKRIYDATLSTLLQVIHKLPNEEEFIAIVGHNPGISEALYYLSGNIKDVPPGSVALVEFDLNTWTEIHENSGKLTFYDTAKD